MYKPGEVDPYSKSSQNNDEKTEKMKQIYNFISSHCILFILLIINT